MGQGPKIVLFFQHYCPEMAHSLYMIEPPLDLSSYEQMIGSDGWYMVDADSMHISPVLAFPNRDQFLYDSACVNLGSKIYFFGGDHEQSRKATESVSYSVQVQVFDTDHPEEGMKDVASMNAPKESPCVFAADGMIYALGSPLDSEREPATSLFERYHPSSNRWEVLDDPPSPLSLWKGTIHLDCATVLGRWVFIADLDAVYNLDTQKWDPSPPPEMAACFLPYSIFVNDDSVYHLCGPGTWKVEAPHYPPQFGGLVEVVKRGPVTEGDYAIKSVHLASAKKQVMAAGLDLDDDIFFTTAPYNTWKELLHMGGPFFCYIVTAQLLHAQYPTSSDEKSRGVWIRFFEEVPTHTGNCNANGDNNCNCIDTKFRQLAYFCYKIVTDFRNSYLLTRCSVLGTVPDFKEEENRKLKAQLVENDEILKAYEALLVKTGGLGIVGREECNSFFTAPFLMLRVLTEMSSHEADEFSQLLDLAF